ncbi:MAG: DUF6232 family protein [Hormoscilla sp.]
MLEKTPAEPIYNKNDIRITRNVLDLKGDRYQIRYIDTIKTSRKDPEKKLKLRLIYLGVLVVIVGLGIARAELVLLGLLLIYMGNKKNEKLKTLKSTYTVTMTTTMSKDISHSSEDGAEIAEIIAAMETAMNQL